MDIDAGDGSPVVVAMPAEVDLINAERVYDQLYAALISGAAVVIADFTATTFCDSAGMNLLITIHKRAVSRGVQFCLVLPSGGTVRRVLKLLGLDQMLPVYSTVAEATSALATPFKIVGSPRRKLFSVLAWSGPIPTVRMRSITFSSTSAGFRCICESINAAEDCASSLLVSASR